MRKSLEEIEDAARRMGRTIGHQFPPGTGFCLMLYHFGDGGFATWVSNGERQSMCAGVLELIGKVYEDPATDEVTRAQICDWAANIPRIE